jgi:hypothetical protein
MVFQIGVILVSTMEPSRQIESDTGNNTLFTMVSELDRPVFAINFVK